MKFENKNLHKKKHPFIAYNLKAIRNVTGITQLQISNALSLNRTTITHWEVGSCEPSLTNLLCLIEFYKSLGYENINYEILLSHKLSDNDLLKFMS